jgi:hypothetical protein
MYSLCTADCVAGRLRIGFKTHAALAIRRESSSGVDSGRGDRGLEVLCEPAIASDPSEESLDDPSTRQDGEADLIGMLVDTGLRRLHALAVDDSRRGTGLPPNPFTIDHDERVVDLLEQTGIAPCGKPTIDRAPRRKVRWQLSPRAAGAQMPLSGMFHKPRSANETEMKLVN